MIKQAQKPSSKGVDLWKTKTTFTIIFLVLISVIVLFWVVPYFTQPVGVPLDFYEKSNDFNHSNMNIYYIGENNPFNKRVHYNDVSSVSSIPSNNHSTSNAIIVEFSENITLSETDYVTLESLHLDNCFYVILINYTDENLNELIDSSNLGDDLIFLDFSICGDSHFSSSVSLPEEIDLQNTQYIITHLLYKKIENE